MRVFSVTEVAQVLRISRSTIRTLVRAGYVAPARGRSRRYEFSFQDLVALRTARALLQARVSPRRISRAIQELRQQVPSAPVPGSLRVCASGTHVVVRDEAAGSWHTPAGQYLLEFDVRVKKSVVSIHDRAGNGRAGREASAAKRSDLQPFSILDDETLADQLFDRALSLEARDAPAAIKSYLECLDVDSGYLAARINCGRLLHAAERLAEAESVYREAGDEGLEDPDLCFNYALVLEDTGRPLEAIDAYKRALTHQPDFADAHFNLARVYQDLSMARAAIRHWNCYRRLKHRGG